MAGEYARRLPDLRAETPLDRAMLATFAELCGSAARGPVADLGCGTGRVTAHLDSLGLEAFGIDLSPAMVDIARLHHPHLHFSVGSLTALDLGDASVGGVMAWYSTLHTPPQELDSVFAGFSRVLVPGGHLLVGFHVGDGTRARTVAYRSGVSVAAYDMTPDEAAALCGRAGLEMHTQLLRIAQGRENRPQASLIAVKAASSPAAAGSM